MCGTHGVVENTVQTNGLFDGQTQGKGQFGIFRRRWKLCGLDSPGLGFKPCVGLL